MILKDQCSTTLNLNLQLWWKARGKKKEFFRSMAPGAVLTTSTFPHHQWLATVKTNKEALLLNNEKIYTPKRSAQNTRDRLIIRRQGIHLMYYCSCLASRRTCNTLD